jgi:hypothetical protein
MLLRDVPNSLERLSEIQQKKILYEFQKAPMKCGQWLAVFGGNSQT